MPCSQCQISQAQASSTSASTANVGVVALLIGAAAVGIYYLSRGK